MRTMPLLCSDPNIGRRIRDRRQISAMQSTWPYGFNAPIAVRYSGDAFSRAGWIWPVAKNGVPIKALPYTAVGFYVAKYVNKKVNLDIIKKCTGGNEWNKSLKERLDLIPGKVFRVRMSRNFGMKVPSMDNLSMEALVQMTRLSSRTTPLQLVLRQNARRNLRSRLAALSVSDILTARPPTINLLKFLRNSMVRTLDPRLLNFTSIATPRLESTDISEEVRQWLHDSGLTFAQIGLTPSFVAGGK
ncbi:replication endonuclease [Lelliottia sp. SL45]|uniref:replication endonuclease n=1 Tax=Lelliottia sp. SL45 TaxID=2994665 RepID=UPI0022745B0B|nr:replication endonuclease [Lelliottia sp. SL45]MCY1701123.1 replication endonuclease [Lelliottia sp. SL45]